MACGGKGVISVLSNVLPGETSQLCRKCAEGDYVTAMALQAKYLNLIHALFSEVNPIPAKAAMAAMGFCENYVRLPLVPMEEANRQKLLQYMRELGVNV
jgi:4-hydroxy-tetrahydrodipicolinate synthase